VAQRFNAAKKLPFSVRASSVRVRSAIFGFVLEFLNDTVLKGRGLKPRRKGSKMTAALAAAEISALGSAALSALR
jgi:hypothetical protein